jgi:hypothetical protein
LEAAKHKIIKIEEKRKKYLIDETASGIINLGAVSISATAASIVTVFDVLFITRRK